MGAPIVLLLATFVLLATVLLAARRKRQALSRRIESMWPEKMRSPQLSVGDACDRSGVALGLGGGGGVRCGLGLGLGHGSGLGLAGTTEGG